MFFQSLQFYVGLIDEVQHEVETPSLDHEATIERDSVGTSSLDDETDSAILSSSATHSVTSIYVAGDSDAQSSARSQTSHDQNSELSRSVSGLDEPDQSDTTIEGNIASQEAKLNATPSVVNAKRLAAGQTVAARLSRLEKSLNDLIQCLPPVQAKNDHDVNHQPVEDMVASLTNRLSTVEHILHGFGDIDVTKAENPKADSKSDIEVADVSDQIIDIKLADGEDSVVDKDGVESQDWSIIESDEARNGVDKVKRKSLVFHLDERESRTELTIRELATEITDLKARIDSTEMNTDTTTTINEIELTVSKLSDHLERKLSDMTTSIEDKVSKEIYARDTESIREALEDCKNSLESDVIEPPDELARLTSTLSDMSLKIEELAKSKLDQDELHQLMDSQDASWRSLVEGEIAKQNLLVSSASDKMASEIEDVRLMVNAHLSTDSQLAGETGVQSNVSVHQPNKIETILIEPNNLEEMIQHAATSVRDSLEESFTKRLDELKSIEDELNGLVSQLTEKPRQDQVDSVLQTLEANISERISQDTELQFLIENMKKGE